MTVYLTHATIIMPLAAHVKDADAMHTAMRARIVDEFGGVTITNGDGSWRNPGTGEIESEPVRIYSIAINTLAYPTSYETVTAIAQSFGGMLMQKAVYIDFGGAIKVLDSDTAALAKLAEQRNADTHHPDGSNDQRIADRIDGYDRDDTGLSPDF